MQTDLFSATVVLSVPAIGPFPFAIYVVVASGADEQWRAEIVARLTAAAALREQGIGAG